MICLFAAAMSAGSRPLLRLLNRDLHIAYVVHAMVIASGGLLVYNVETTTRVLFSSSPLLYLIIARHLAAQSSELADVKMLISQSALKFWIQCLFKRPRIAIVAIYLLAYCFIGTLLHVNWAPFV